MNFFGTVNSNRKSGCTKRWPRIRPCLMSSPKGSPSIICKCRLRPCVRGTPAAPFPEVGSGLKAAACSRARTRSSVDGCVDNHAGAPARRRAYSWNSRPMPRGNRLALPAYNRPGPTPVHRYHRPHIPATGYIRPKWPSRQIYQIAGGLRVDPVYCLAQHPTHCPQSPPRPPPYAVARRGVPSHGQFHGR